MHLVNNNAVNNVFNSHSRPRSAVGIPFRLINYGKSNKKRNVYT